MRGDGDENDSRDKAMTKSVSFCKVEIIELPIILGDSPSVSTGGPPMCVGWKPLRRSKLPVDEYETKKFKRPGRSKTTKRGLIISGPGRRDFFLRCGYSKNEIEHATFIAQQYKREMTISKIFNDAPPTVDRFASDIAACSQTLSSNSEYLGMSTVPLSRKNSPTAVLVTLPSTTKRSTTAQHSVASFSSATNVNLQPLVKPRRMSSPSTGESSFRKRIICRNQSLPMDIEMMASAQRLLPPTLPTRTPSQDDEFPPISRRPSRRRNTSPTDICRCFITEETSSNQQRHQSLIKPVRKSSPHALNDKTRKRFGGNQSMPVVNDDSRHDHQERPPAQPSRCYSPSNITLRNEVKAMSVSQPRSSSHGGPPPALPSLSSTSPTGTRTQLTRKALNSSPNRPGLQMPVRRLSPPSPAMSKACSEANSGDRSSCVGGYHHDTTRLRNRSTNGTVAGLLSRQGLPVSPPLPPPPPPSSSTSATIIPSPPNNTITSGQPRRRKSPPLESQKAHLRRCA